MNPFCILAPWRWVWGVLFVCCLPASDLSAATAFDHTAWDTFLKKYVNEKGDVDYQAVRSDPAALQDYLDSLAAVDIAGLRDWPREEVLAYWLNAYHAAMIKLVVDHYPQNSVQTIPGFWDIAAIRFDTPDKESQNFSLNAIRTKSLIGVHRDEKIHLVLSMAARGGPHLPREAFTGAKVEGQLFLLTRRFVTDPAFVDVQPGRKKIRVSRLFKWYARDFNLDFGIPEPIGRFSPEETSVLSFLSYYLEDESKEEYLQEGRFKIDYMTFDWDLNDWKTK